MACANEKCKARTWCEVQSREAKEPEACEQAALISSWWKAKISGKRDPEIPFADEEEFGEEDFDADDF